MITDDSEPVTLAELARTAFIACWLAPAVMILALISPGQARRLGLILADTVEAFGTLSRDPLAIANGRRPRRTPGEGIYSPRNRT